MLDAEGSGKRKHTFADDMESLLYVIMYCGYLWLPHNLSKDKLTRTIKRFFEARTWSINQGDYLGGQGKSEEVEYRWHTAEVEFNAPLQELISTVLDYCYPLPGEMSRIFCENGQWVEPRTPR